MFPNRRGFSHSSSQSSRNSNGNSTWSSSNSYRDSNGNFYEEHNGPYGPTSNRGNLFSRGRGRGSSTMPSSSRDGAWGGAGRGGYHPPMMPTGRFPLQGPSFGGMSDPLSDAMFTFDEMMRSARGGYGYGHGRGRGAYPSSRGGYAPTPFDYTAPTTGNTDTSPTSHPRSPRESNTRSGYPWGPTPPPPEFDNAGFADFSEPYTSPAFAATFTPQVPRVQQISTFLSQHTTPYTALPTASSYSSTPVPLNSECPVCLDPPSSYHPCVRIIGIEGCKHMIGKKCLKAMLDLRPDDKKECPLCRSEWLKEDGVWQDFAAFEAMENAGRGGGHGRGRRNGNAFLGGY